MATTAFLTARALKQGDVRGSVTEKGREGSIALIAVSYQIETPVDTATGAVTGKRQHRPVTITKVVDQATPKFLQALVSNEVLTEVKIEFWRTAPESASPYFVIALANASVEAVSFASSGNQEPHETEQISFTYRKITWTFVDSGGSAQDDWNVS
jgi:type VI secretion system secreted protein Hcp